MIGVAKPIYYYSHNFYKIKIYPLTGRHSQATSFPSMIEEDFNRVLDTQAAGRTFDSVRTRTWDGHHIQAVPVDSESEVPLIAHKLELNNSWCMMHDVSKIRPGPFRWCVSYPNPQVRVYRNPCLCVCHRAYRNLRVACPQVIATMIPLFASVSYTSYILQYTTSNEQVVLNFLFLLWKYSPQSVSKGYSKLMTPARRCTQVVNN